MGYTHYFYQNKNVSATQWEMICRTFRKIVKALKDGLRSESVAGAQYMADLGFDVGKDGDLIAIQPEYDYGWKDYFTHEKDVGGELHLAFNGVGDMAHETFVLAAEIGSDDYFVHGEKFSFCKTNGKPYDAVVVAMLIAMKAIAPDVFRISSDGDIDDWQPGLALLSFALKKPTKIQFQENTQHYPELVVLPITEEDRLAFDLLIKDPVLQPSLKLIS